MSRKTQKSKGKVSLKTLIKLAKKYRVTPSGSRKKLAEGLSGLRGSYLSKSEINLILPLLSNNVNKKILLKYRDGIYTRKKLPKN